MKNKSFSKLKFVAIIIAAMLVSENIYCQEMKHQFSVSAGGFFSNLNYDIKRGDVEQGYGINAGLRYTYYFNSNWSIGLGAEYQNFNSTAKMDLAEGNYNAADSEGESFEFRYKARGFNEAQSIKYITVPFIFQYEGTGYPGFYVAAGAKIGLPLKSKYETTIENLSTSGYYPQYNVELFDPRFAGYGNFGKISAGEQELDVNVSYIATFEAGIKRYINTNSALYLGLYFDYGFNNVIKKETEKQIVAYNNAIPVNFNYNTVLETSDTGDVKIMSYGIKVRYAFW